MTDQEKWVTIKSMVQQQAEVMRETLEKNPELKDWMTSPTFIRFTKENWSQLKPGKSVIIGITGAFMIVCRWRS